MVDVIFSMSKQPPSKHTLPNAPAHSPAKHLSSLPLPSHQDNLTAAKRPEPRGVYSQVTPRPQRKILLYGSGQERFLFPLVRDREVGIEAMYQEVVIETHNDDDRETTSTQLQRGMGQTLEDLYDVLSRNHSSSASSRHAHSFYSQRQ